MGSAIETKNRSAPRNAGTGTRAGSGIRIAAIRRLISSFSSEYDLRFHLPDGEEIATRCVAPDGRRTDFYVRDAVGLRALLSMRQRPLYEAYTGQHIDVEGHMEDVMRWGHKAVSDPHRGWAEVVAKLQSMEERVRPTRYRTDALKTHYSFPSEFYTTWLGDDDLPVFSQYFFEEGETTADPKVHIASVAPLLGEAIRRINNEESVSSLFV